MNVTCVFVIFNLFYMHFHDFTWLLHDCLWFAVHSHWFYMILCSFICVLMCLYAFLICLWAWCAQSACLRRFADLRKNTPLEFGSMYLVYFVDFVTFSLVCPIRVPAALRRPQKKHAPGFLEQVCCVFCWFLSLLAWCAQSACLRRFADLRKNTPPEFWSMYPVCFVDFCLFLFNF